MIKLKSHGNFNKTVSFFDRILKHDYLECLAHYGELGVKALSSATPVDTGKTAKSWRYEITKEDHRLKIYWCNDNVNDGVNIAVILEYGHGTRNGGYVQGRDYINPAIAPIFDEIAGAVWKEVVSK